MAKGAGDFWVAATAQRRARARACVLSVSEDAVHQNPPLYTATSPDYVPCYAVEAAFGHRVKHSPDVQHLVHNATGLVCVKHSMSVLKPDGVTRTLLGIFG
jgi:nucleoside diphosphate kinase